MVYDKAICPVLNRSRSALSHGEWCRRVCGEDQVALISAEAKSGQRASSLFLFLPQPSSTPLPFSFSFLSPPILDHFSFLLLVFSSSFLFFFFDGLEGNQSP
jgi:hypothetical protein